MVGFRRQLTIAANGRVETVLVYRLIIRRVGGNKLPLVGLSSLHFEPVLNSVCLSSFDSI